MFHSEKPWWLFLKHQMVKFPARVGIHLLYTRVEICQASQNSSIPKHASTHVMTEWLFRKYTQIPPLFSYAFRQGIHGEGLVRPPRQGTIYRCDVFLCNWRVSGLLTSWKCETWHIPGTEITCWRVRDGGEMEQERVMCAILGRMYGKIERKQERHWDRE